MPGVFMIFPTNISFHFESSQNTILASRQASFLQSTLSSFNFFLLSPLSPFGFLEIDVGIWNSFKWYLNFLMASLYLKHPFILTTHSLYCDLNVETLKGNVRDTKNYKNKN
jgi:hypothetical protein